MVAASGTLVLLSAIGAAIGSPLTAFAMDIFGSEAFYGSIGAMMTIIGGFAVWRYLQRNDVELDEEGDFVVMVTSPLTVSLNTDVELDEIEAAGEEDAEDIVTSFEELVSDLELAAEEDSEQEK